MRENERAGTSVPDTYISGKRLIWKAHNSKSTCGKFDVYVRFKSEEQLFTKGKTILKQAFKKIGLFDI
jgi:hypothetical protein